LDGSQIGIGLLFAGLGLIVMVAIVGGLLYSKNERLLTHAERMKALEMGHGLPEDIYTARIRAAMGHDETPGRPGALSSHCFTSTTYICGFGFFFAMMSGQIPSVAVTIAASTGAVGVAGMICGTILATKNREPAGAPGPPLPAKSTLDPEAI
jgi:hypothetical protein